MRSSSGEALQNEYKSRINLVIDYIHRHYDEDLSVAKLAGIACISKYHFQRIFQSIVGETVGDFSRRVRAYRAMHKLTADLDKSITEIALECGFSSSQNFSKIFKSYFGLTPSFVRTEYHWRNWGIKMRRLQEKKIEDLQPAEWYLYNVYCNKRQLPIGKMPDSQAAPQVQIKQMPATHVAYIRTIGPHRRTIVDAKVKRLIQWARPKGLVQEGFRILVVRWCDTEITPEDKWIHDVCITVPQSVKADRWVNVQTVPGGAYAVHHCQIGPDQHNEAWFNLILNWLISSDYQLDYRPFYQIYCSDPEANPLKNDILDLYLPVRPLYE
jgi:AraC family transcriptional regulator